jgi:acyl-CoA synthetase (AMP-forming)/AMP-acid ligase II
MSSSANLIEPEYLRLSGEIADQSILNHLQSFYPQAQVVHAFASTEAGVAFDVTDGIEGFPAGVLKHTPNVEMKVENHSLWIRSARTAIRYLDDEFHSALRDPEGFVDTGDMIELRDGRYYFVGRRNGVINVGGLKVHPEEVEAVINRHPEVEMSRVRMKRNPSTGSLVVADVVLKAASQSSTHDVHELKHNILLFCRGTLSSYKVPGAIYFVPVLTIAETGKLLRRYA